jgi:hypothetical protein
MAAPINFNDTAFREQFAAFASTTQYTPSTLQAYWDTATAYVSNRSGGCYTGGLSLAQQTLALNLMTAHLVFLANAIATGNTPGVTVGATVDKVSVTLQPPPAPNQWQYWLNQSAYGQQLLALLQVASAGGFYAASGVPGRAGFWFGNGF